MYRLATVVLLVLSVRAVPTFAQKCDDETIQKDRRQAVDLRRDGKFVQSIPLWEKVVAACPDDVEALEGLGVALAGESARTENDEKRKALQARAREALLRSQKLGNNSNLLQITLGAVPEGGTDSATFSAKEEVDKVMKRGEQAFGRGDYDAAREAYLQALLIDPNTYYAALFIGDVFYKQGKLGSAGEWFARAIQIDPNRETAHRYWGDALMAGGDMRSAREKFIDAVLADPYGKGPWIGLQQWAKREGHDKLRRPNISPRASVKAETPGSDGKSNTNITLDISMFSKTEKDPSGSAWMMYGLRRALWQGERFSKEFPAEKKYRHSLKEEMDAFAAALEAVSNSERDKKGKVKTKDESLKVLVELNEKGLLAAHILFFMADEGIAQDYAVYREAQRDKLRHYLDEYIAPKAK